MATGFDSRYETNKATTSLKVETNGLKSWMNFIDIQGVAPHGT